MRLKKTFTKLSCNKKGLKVTQIFKNKNKIATSIKKLQTNHFEKHEKNSKMELFINKYKNNTEEKAFEKHDKKRQKRKIVCKGE